MERLKARLKATWLVAGHLYRRNLDELITAGKRWPVRSGASPLT